MGCNYYKEARGCKSRLAYDMLKEAGMLKEEIKTPVKKTGVHKTAEDLVEGAVLVTIPFKDDDSCYSVDNRHYPQRSYIPEGYEHFYKDIIEEVNYSQIPVGSIVNIRDKKSVNWYGSFVEFKDGCVVLQTCGTSYTFSPYNIHSLKIIKE
jgi:hypothetical protein